MCIIVFVLSWFILYNATAMTIVLSSIIFTINMNQYDVTKARIELIKISLMLNVDLCWELVRLSNDVLVMLKIYTYIVYTSAIHEA